MLKALLILAFVMPSFNGIAQQFKNLKATMEAGKVVVSYDFSTEKEGLAYDVKLECSEDGGATFKLFPKLLSGDIHGISSGSGKKIFWDVQKEHPDLSGNPLVFQLVAIENKPIYNTVNANPTPINAGTFSDSRDGHIYNWIKIGSQIWMAENLAFLPAVFPARESSPSKPYCYVYGYVGTNPEEAKATNSYKTYGVLYNWEAATKACPVGWHLPTEKEWEQLEIELGMTHTQAKSTGSRCAECGAKLKSVKNWNKSGNGNNASSFSGLPGGGRYDDGSFGNMGGNGFWWSASECDRSFSWGRGLGYESSEIYKGVNYKEGGFSVRCVKDF